MERIKSLLAEARSEIIGGLIVAIMLGTTSLLYNIVADLSSSTRILLFAMWWLVIGLAIIIIVPALITNPSRKRLSQILGILMILGTFLGFAWQARQDPVEIEVTREVPILAGNQVDCRTALGEYIEWGTNNTVSFVATSNKRNNQGILYSSFLSGTFMVTNNSLFYRGEQVFSDRDNFNGPKDEIAITLKANGEGSVNLISWDYEDVLKNMTCIEHAGSLHIWSSTDFGGTWDITMNRN
jgi:hypothetical protein